MIGGYNNNGYSFELFLLLHNLEHFHAIHLRHLQVQKHHGKLVFMGLNLLQRLDPVGGVEYLVVLLEHVAQNQLVDLHVLNNEYVTLEMHDLRVFVFWEQGCRSLLRVLARNGAHALEQLLLLVHEVICPLEHVVETGVLFGVVVREAARYNDFVCAYVHNGAVVQRQNQLVSNKIVAIAKDDGKLVSARSIDGAVLENIAYHLARALNVLIACLVAKRVVNYLQTVHVADGDGKLAHGLVFYGRVDFVLLQEEGVLALYSGQWVGERDVLGLIALLGCLLFPPLHVRVVDEHDYEGDAEQTHDHKDAGIVCLVELRKLCRKEFVLVLLQNLGACRAVHVAANLGYDGALSAFV